MARIYSSAGARKLPRRRKAAPHGSSSAPDITNEVTTNMIGQKTYSE